MSAIDLFMAHHEAMMNKNHKNMWPDYAIYIDQLATAVKKDLEDLETRVGVILKSHEDTINPEPPQPIEAKDKYTLHEEEMLKRHRRRLI